MFVHNISLIPVFFSTLCIAFISLTKEFFALASAKLPIVLVPRNFYCHHHLLQLKSKVLEHFLLTFSIVFLFGLINFLHRNEHSSCLLFLAKIFDSFLIEIWTVFLNLLTQHCF